MNIIKKSPGIMLLEQYGNKYIRFDAGQIVDMILQIQITEEECTRIQNGEITMAGVVNDYDNRGLCSPDQLRNNLMKDYLRTVTNYSPKRLDMIIQKLYAHKGVYYEFHDYVLLERFPINAITVEGMTAEYLAANYPLTPLGAYNYLIYLREMPEQALADLKKGLPCKKLMDEKRLKEIQALIEKEKNGEL